MNFRECIFILFLLIFEFFFNYIEKNVFIIFVYILLIIDSENLGWLFLYGFMLKLELF